MASNVRIVRNLRVRFSLKIKLLLCVIDVLYCPPAPIVFQLHRKQIIRTKSIEHLVRFQ